MLTVCSCNGEIVTTLITALTKKNATHQNRYRCNNLPGNVMIAFNKPKTPSTAMPRILKGNSNNHTMGYNTNARIASGQQSINKIIQQRNVNI